MGKQRKNGCPRLTGSADGKRMITGAFPEAQIDGFFKKLTAQKQCRRVIRGRKIKTVPTSPYPLTFNSAFFEYVFKNIFFFEYVFEKLFFSNMYWKKLYF